ncbi:hypothetical protein ACN47E_009579 [Coniothyrium glycines]
MDGLDDLLTRKVQSLGDLELAVLISLVADQHCIIETDKALFENVKRELQLVASNVFGLSWAVLDCDKHMTLDDFGTGILVIEDNQDYFNVNTDKLRDEISSLPSPPRLPDRRRSKSPQTFNPLDNRKIANIIIATNLNTASTEVQIQALELIRGKRNFTRTAVHAAPKPFLLVALNIVDSERLTMHLNDQFFISHRHRDEHGFPNLEELQNEDIHKDDDSASSVIRTPPFVLAKQKQDAVLLSSEDLAQLSSHIAEVKISSEVRAYLHNIVVFLRLHRAVGGGISALATRHFNILAHTLAPLHGLSFISPSLVALAARKVYPHRISITSPENERSMQWGSSLEAVKAVLEGVTVDDVIEEVLQSVEAPL